MCCVICVCCVCIYIYVSMCMYVCMSVYECVCVCLRERESYNGQKVDYYSMKNSTCSKAEIVSLTVRLCNPNYSITRTKSECHDRLHMQIKYHTRDINKYINFKKCQFKDISEYHTHSHTKVRMSHQLTKVRMAHLFTRISERHTMSQRSERHTGSHTTIRMAHQFM